MSPLLFSIISDVLIRRVRRLSPSTLLRAYADDIALVLHSLACCSVLEPLFSNYGDISGLRLHYGKSMVVPLMLAPFEQVRHRIAAVAPRWGAFSIAGHAKYLGFLLGPTRGDLLWDDIFRRMEERAWVWNRIGGGLLVSITAYRVYILPLAGFVAQLRDLPPQWPQVERLLMTALCPGARG